MTIPRNLSFLAQGASSTGVLSVPYGGTGVTSFTAGYIPYGNGTGAFNSSSNLTFDGTNLGVGGSQISVLNSGGGFPGGINLIATYGNVSTQIIQASVPGGATNLALKTGAVEVMRLYYSGGVSIGNTTDPGATNLSVTGSSTSASFIPSSSTVPTNGVFLPATNSLGIATNSTNRMTVDASGNLGLGTSSPVTLKTATTFQVVGNIKVGNDNAAGLVSLGDISSTGANAGIWRGAGGAYGSTGNFLCLGGYSGITFTSGAADISAQTEAMRIFASGGVSVGNTTDLGVGNLNVNGVTKTLG